MKKRDERRDFQKERHWLGIIQRREHSGESVRAFCRRAKVTESAYYWWRRELSRRHVKHSADQQHGGVARFLPVEVSDAGKAKESGIELRLGASCVLYLRQGFDRQTLADVLSAWEGRGC
jgi:hypothetical protein